MYRAMFTYAEAATYSRAAAITVTDEKEIQFSQGVF